MSGAGKMGDRGGGRESTKSLNKSKQTKHAIETDQKKSREQYMLTRPKYSPSAPPVALPAADENLQPMIDASCHLLSRSFNRDLIAVMRRARESGVIGCVLHCDWTRITELMSLAKQWPGAMFATIGISPDLIKKNNDRVYEQRMEQLLDLALQPEVVAISCGLDLTRDLGTHFLQAKLFAAQVALAKQVRLPVLVNEKAACEQVCEQLQTAREAQDADRVSASASAHPHGKPAPIELSTASSSPNPFPKIAVHNFNGSQADLERYLKSDCFIIVNGVVCDVKQAGEAAASATASKDEVSAKAKRDAESKQAEGEEEGEGEAPGEDEAEEVGHVEESDGTGFKAAALVGPADLTGSGAHLFHLIRSGLLPLERLMVSTDAPLHTPQNIADFYVRTSRNEPSNMHHIFVSLAKAYSLPIATIQAKVYENSKAFFGLLHPEEAKAEEDRHAEKEKAKQMEEKKLVDREKRNDAEAKKKAEREKLAAAAETEQGGGGGGKRKNKAAAKDPAPAPTAVDSEDEDKKKKGGKKGGKAAAGKPVAAGKKAAGDDSDSDGGWGKQKNKKQQAQKNKKQAAVKSKGKKGGDSDDEESEEESDSDDDGPKDVEVVVAKSKSKAKAPAAAKSKKPDSDDDEQEEVKPKKAAAPAISAAKKKPAKDESSSSESEDEAPVKAKKKPAKKVESSEESSESEDEKAKAKSKAKAKKAAKAESSSEESDSDSDSDGEVKKSAETIAAAKRARAAAIKKQQEAEFIARTQGASSAVKKKAGAKKGKGADADEVDELDAMMMASSIDGLEAANAEAKKKLEKAQRKAKAAAGDQADAAEEELVQFRCRKCQAKLFTHEAEVGHDESSAAASSQDVSSCEQLFIARPAWLAEDALEESASTQTAVDLCCFKCNAKLGRVSAKTPIVCACGRPGAGPGPYVSVKLSRVDAVTTAAASVRGPRAMDADELDKAKADADESAERWRQKEKERMRAKDKKKKESLMPVTNSVGNFTQFRNKTDMRPVAGGGKKKREYEKTEEEE